MARPQGFTDYTEDKVLRHLLKIASWTAPTNLYVGLHVATQLAAAADPSDDEISVDHEIVEGAKLIVGAGTAGQEVCYAGAVSGEGPYTVGLVDEAGETFALTNGHAIDAYVWFDPADDGSNKIEPSASTYARVLQNAWNNPADASGVLQSTNDGSVAFAAATDAAWGLVTHWFLIDASSGGNVLAIGELSNGTDPTPQQVVLNATLTFPTATLKVKLG